MVFTGKLKIALLILLTVVVIGTIGFHVIEKWSLIDSFYSTVITLATVGYGDYTPATTQGKLFTVFIIITGVGTMLFAVGQISETVIEGRLRGLLERGRLQKMIKNIENHYIICGYGRIGRLIGRELGAENVPFVVIDNDPDVIERVQDEGIIYYRGDATQDKTLIEAGVKRAKGIICVLPTDAQNLYVILTARELNRDIFIMSRSEEEESEHRLLRAGADRVTSPYTMGGVRMAMAILRPAMLDFIEISTNRQSMELRMEEIMICKQSPFIGKSLEASEIRKRYGLIIIAVKKDSGKMIFNPMANYIIDEADRLIALGEDENVRQFAESCPL